jgi:hypothetical protein
MENKCAIYTKKDCLSEETNQEIIEYFKEKYNYEVYKTYDNSDELFEDAKKYLFAKILWSGKGFSISEIFEFLKEMTNIKNFGVVAISENEDNEEVKEYMREIWKTMDIVTLTHCFKRISL